MFSRELDKKENLIKDLKHTPLEPIKNHQGIRKWNDHPGREKVMGCPEIVFGNCGRNEKV